MEKISQAFVLTISTFQKRLQSFLENDFDSKSEAAKDLQKDFEVSRDKSLIRGLSAGLPEDHIDRAIVVFSRLSLLFDAGILLENHDGEWCPQALFHLGHTELLKGSTKNQLHIPAIDLLTVLKTDSQGILQKLQLQKLDPQGRMSCLLVKATPDFSFLLFSVMPDLWLKEHIKQVRTALINGFAD